MSIFYFFILFIIILILLFRKKVLKEINKINYLKNLSVENFILYLIFLFFLTILIGVMNPEKTKKKYDNISENFDNLRKPDDVERPNPMFDINTYKDSHEWGN